MRTSVKLVRFEHADAVEVGIVEGDEIIAAGDDIFHPVASTRRVPLAEVRLLPPIAAPRKIICLGLNYRDHALETGQPIPEIPITFTKYSTCLVGSGADIVIPPEAGFVDYEAELAVVIGTGGRRIREEDAYRHVLGYTCLNDVSARQHQSAEGQWGRAKSFDTFGPVGPWIVTTDEVPDPHDLRISCVLNGEFVQDSRTSEMIFNIPHLIAWLSATSTLEPGDIIATGTPPGVGQARKPPLWLVDGDIVTIAIEGIGELTNHVRAELA